MRITEIILEDMNLANKKFVDQGASEQEVLSVLRKFEELRDKNQLQGQQRDINWWVKQGFDKLKQTVVDLAAIPTKRQRKLGRVRQSGDRIIIADTDKYTIAIPLTLDASRNLAPKSSFCTTKLGSQGLFNQYFGALESTIIYFIHKDKQREDGSWTDWSKDVMAIMYDPTKGITYWDFNNERMTNGEFNMTIGWWMDTKITPEWVMDIVNKYEPIMAPYREQSKMIRQQELGQNKS